MRLTQHLVWATAVAAAGLVAACTGATTQAPTAPSAIESPASSALTEAQTAALAAECQFGSGTAIINPGPPPSGPPSAPGTPPTSGSAPGGPAGPAPPGTHVALGGVLEGRAGECPAITFTIGGKTVRTGGTTSFGSGSCSSFDNGDRIGAMGVTEADGSIVASCVAAGS